VSILLPYSVMQEISHRNTPPEVKERAAEFIFTIEVNLTGEEYVIFNQVHKILRGNSQAEKHRKDAFHLFEGYKYCGNYFITTDRRILKKGDLIYKLINIMPVDPDSYIDILKQFGILDNGQES